MPHLPSLPLCSTPSQSPRYARNPPLPPTPPSTALPAPAPSPPVHPSPAPPHQALLYTTVSSSTNLTTHTSPSGVSKAGAAAADRRHSRCWSSWFGCRRLGGASVVCKGRFERGYWYWIRGCWWWCGGVWCVWGRDRRAGTGGVDG